MHKHLNDIAVGIQDTYPLTAQYLNGIYGLAKKLSFQMSTNAAVDSYEDFFQVMLIEACNLEEKFDHTRGNSFYTFINRPLKAKAFREFVAVDKNSDTYKTIKEFVKAYGVKHDTYPQVEVISEATGFTSEVIKTIYYGKTPQVSLDALSEDFVSDMGDSLEINPLDYLEYLDDVEATVINLLYGDIHENIAEAFAMNYLCITKVALDIIHTRALDKLRDAIESLS